MSEESVQYNYRGQKVTGRHPEELCPIRIVMLAKERDELSAQMHQDGFSSMDAPGRSLFLMYAAGDIAIALEDIVNNLLSTEARKKGLRLRKERNERNRTVWSSRKELKNDFHRGLGNHLCNRDFGEARYFSH